MVPEYVCSANKGHTAAIHLAYMLIHSPAFYYITQYTRAWAWAWMHETCCITAFRFITIMNAKSKLRQFRFSKEIYSTLWWCTRIMFSMAKPYTYNKILPMYSMGRASVWMNRKIKKTTRNWIECKKIRKIAYIWNCTSVIYLAKVCDSKMWCIYFTIFYCMWRMEGDSVLSWKQVF